MQLETPIVDKLREYGKKLTVSLILMRSGGLDGVAIQADEYRTMLTECIDVDVKVITGLDERHYSPSETASRPTVIDRLNFNHPDSLLLFGNEFTIGPETDGVEKLSDAGWVKLFELHKNSIRDDIDAIISSIPYDAPVIIFNLLSLRHAHPAAAAALRELIEKYPNRAFLSHAADPDAERPEKISRIKPFILKYISANGPEDEYSGGPYKMENLYHIVLNPKQHESFLYKYMIKSDHVFEIPDFLEFDTATPVIPERPDEGFKEYLESRCIFADGDKYKYSTVPLPDDAVYFLSPVRPVYRKRIKEAMLVAYHYGNVRNKTVVFVITHPDIDDRQYFQETVKFANAMGIQYIHLGKSFTIKKLNYVYRNFASLHTIGVVASSSGGWENALNELAASCIPFFMSISLNSFKTLTEEMEIESYGMDFSGLSNLLKTGLAERLSSIDLSGIAYMQSLLEWIDEVLTPEGREEVVINNFNQAYKFLSQQAAARRLLESVHSIYDRHKPKIGELFPI
jgi:hypothetical protein